MGFLRRTSGAQGDRAIVIKQDGFLGGMNLDLPSSEIDATEVADAENMVFYRTHAESRSGWTQYGTSLPTTANRTSFFHKAQKKWIISDSSGDVYVYNEDYTSGSLVGSVGDGRVSILEYNNDAIVLCSGAIYLIELSNSNYFRTLNASNPEIKLQIASTITTGAYVYRYTYSWARYVNDVLIAESGTVYTGQNEVQYTEINMNAPISTNSNVTITGTHSTPSTSVAWTHVRIYRTLDIGVNGVELGNDPNKYYLCSLLTRDQLDDYSNIPVIGNMIIGSTFVVGDSTVFGNNVGLDDDALIGSTLCKVLDYIPIPSGSIGDIDGGYLLVSPDNTNTYYYSSTGVLERLGYYHPAFQYGVIKGIITHISASRDAFVIICKQQTYRLSNKTYQDAGSIELGISTPQLAPAQLMDETLGTLFPNSMEKIDGSRIIGLLSDHSVRIWNGTAWGKDWGKFKVETELAKIKYAQGLFDPRGIYILFYRYNTSATVATNILRLGLNEDIGIGWTKYTGSSYIYPLVYNSSNYLGKNCVNFTNSDGFSRSIVFGAFSTGTGAAWIETYDATSISRATTDYSNSTATAIACMVQFKDYIGSEERFFINHAQTNLYLRPWDRLGSYLTGFTVTLNAYTDENSSASSTISSTTNYDKDLSFDDPVVGHKIRLKLTTNKAGFKLVGLSSILNVQDRPILRNITTSDRTYIEALTSDLLFRMGLDDPTINMAVANIDGSEIGAYTSTVGEIVVGSSNASTVVGSTTTTTFSTSTYKNAKYISFNGSPS